MYTYGESSSDRCASKATYARPSANRDASIVATQSGFLRPTFSAMLVHSLPPLRVIHRLPSSVPAHRTSGFRGDSASAVALPCLVRVMSGEMIFGSSPFFTDLNTKLPPQYQICELWAERMCGVFQLKRYRGRSPGAAGGASSASAAGGAPPPRPNPPGLIDARSPVRRLYRTMPPF